VTLEPYIQNLRREIDELETRLDAMREANLELGVRLNNFVDEIAETNE